ncbi:MAG: ferrochelatase [Azoarcus sp.]|jgi:ferrochelatase|nr:ferrochelatase [Azoarcus sp.]
MARFRPEPVHDPAHAAHAPIGVLLANLGTPAAPTAAALRPWLRQFLSDPRVVEWPRLIWQPILEGIVLATRPARSAKKYASIWTAAGSPLGVHSERLCAAVAARLDRGREGDAGHDIAVVRAMRYGEPSIPGALEALRARGCGRILVVPLYPQFAASTTASAFDEVARAMQSWRNVPELRFVRSFPDDPGYIAALGASVREHWARHGQGECLVMSFHGQPERTDALGDPYRAECLVTARLLGEALALPAEKLRLTFQSRFGASAWLRPYTQPTIEALAAMGLRRVDVICPGFAADCLETLEEIGMQCRDAFIAHGGETFHRIACLNERPDWVAALAALIRRHLGGWIREAASDSGFPRPPPFPGSDR